MTYSSTREKVCQKMAIFIFFVTTFTFNEKRGLFFDVGRKKKIKNIINRKIHLKRGKKTNNDLV